MQHYRVVLVLTAVAIQAGCACFNGGAAYRPGPAPTPVRTTGVVAPPAPDRSEVAGPLRARRAAWTATAAFANRDAAPADVAPRQAAYRDPQKAFCLACLVAGGGHFYTGETTKGAALLGIAAAGLIGGAVLSSSGGDDPFDCEYEFETQECEPEGDRTPLLVGAGIAAASWVYGIIDARPSAARANARNGQQVGSAAVQMRPVVGLRRTAWGVGLSLRVTW